MGHAQLEVGGSVPKKPATSAPAADPSSSDPGGGGGGVGGGVGGGTVPPVVAVCSTNTYWSSGNSGSSRMNPGLACLSCHAGNAGPDYPIAGTVYQTVKEPDLCNGTGSVTVEITDANGMVFTALTNAAGNFSVSGTIPRPYRARLLYQGRVRAMGSPQMNGDCNSCHTQTGLSGAPGRIMAP